MAYNPMTAEYESMFSPLQPPMTGQQINQLTQSAQQVALNKQIQAENAYKLKAMQQDQDDAKRLQALAIARRNSQIAAAPGISDPGNGDFGGEVGPAVPPAMVQGSASAAPNDFGSEAGTAAPSAMAQGGATIAPAAGTGAPPWGSLGDFNGVDDLVQRTPAGQPLTSGTQSVPLQATAPVVPIATPAPRIPMFSALSQNEMDGLLADGMQPRNLMKYVDMWQSHMKTALEMTAEQRRQTKDMHDAVGQPAVMALQATDPKQQDELWATTLRIAKDHGEDVSMFPNKLPDDPKERETVIKNLVGVNEYGFQVQQQADQHAQELRNSAIAKRQSDQDAAAQLQSQRADLTTQLTQAGDQDAYDATLKKFQPEVTAGVPALIPEQGMTDDFKREILRAGMKPEDRQKDIRAQIDEKAAAKKQADAEAAALLKENKPNFSQGVTEQLYAQGLTQNQIVNGKVTAAQVSKAIRDDAANQVARRPQTNIAIPLSPASAAAAATPPPVGQRNDTFLKTLGPQDQAYIKGLADYDIKPPTGISQSKMQALISNVKLYDPSYDEKEYTTRSGVSQDFSSKGKNGQAIQAIGTALDHGSQLSDLIDKLDNTAIPKYNSFSNWISKNTGSPEVKQFDNTKQKFAEELTQAWIKAGGTGKDRESEKAALDAADSPAQLRNLLADDVNLLQGKYGEALNQYKGSMGRDLPPERGISQQAQAAAQKILAKRGGGTVKMKAPNGQVSDVAADQVEHYKAKGATVVK